MFAAMLEFAAGASQAQVEVQFPWARATIQGQKTAGAYMQLKSAQSANLIGAESPVAGTVEVHEMRIEGNVMRMRAVPRLELPAGKVVELKPGGYHVMLIGLRQPLKKGDTALLRLRVEGGDKSISMIEVKAAVRDSPAVPSHQGR
jgi:hypothetical protein